MTKLKFNWVRNAATDDDEDYYPKAIDIQYVDMEQLIKDIAEPGSIVKETELRTVIRRFFQQLASYVEDGLGFRCEFMVILPVLRGRGTNPSEPWNSEEHKVYVNIRPGQLFKDAAEKIKLTFVPQGREAPVVEFIEDFKSETTDDKLTPGDMIRVTGSQLKIYDSPSGQGVFLIQQSNGQEYPLRLVDNFPAQLLVRVPDDLPSGAYTLKIVNTKQGDSPTLRTTLSEIPLTVD